MSDKNFVPDENIKKLGKQVKLLRKSRKMSQQELSDKSGLAIRTISRIERGLMNPSYVVLSNLVSVLKISFDSLFTSSDDSTDDPDIQEMISLYRACPEQGRRLILASTRAMAHELMDASIE